MTLGGKAGISYLGLLGWCLWQVINSPYRGIEAVVIVYLAFTFTWFECAQFTHLAWWALSYLGISQKELKIGYIFKRTLQMRRHI
jgi:hypothetical protein